MVDKKQKDNDACLIGTCCSMKKSPVAVAAIVLIVVIIAVGIFASSSKDRNISNIITSCEAVSKAFDSNEWIAAATEGKDLSVRAQMVKDLMDNVLYEGITRKQVEGILGKPSDVLRDKYDVAYALGTDCDEAKWFVLDAIGRKIKSWKVVTK